MSKFTMTDQGRWGWAAAGLFACVCLPLVLLNVPFSGGLAEDALNYHLPQINVFLSSPGDIVHYEAYATTLPFYHWMMALVARLFGADAVDNADMAVRVTHFILSAVGVFLYARRIADSRKPIETGLLILPVLTSWYVISGAVSVGTDGPGFSAFVVALLVFAMPRPSAGAGVAAGLVSVAARHLYLPGLLTVAAAHFVSRDEEGRVQFDFREGARSSLLLVPAVLLLAVYVVLWGGLTPPGLPQQLNPSGVFLHSIVGALAVTGIWGGAFACLFAERLLPVLRDRFMLIAIGVVSLVVVGLWFASTTTFSMEEGRFGSLVWQVSDIVAVGGRSLVVLALALGGGAVLTLFGVWSWREGKMPWALIGLAGLIIGLGATFAAYQRYIEPACIVCLGMTVAALGFQRTGWFALKAAPLVLLSLLGAGVTLSKVMAAIG